MQVRRDEVEYRVRLRQAARAAQERYLAGALDGLAERFEAFRRLACEAVTESDARGYFSGYLQVRCLLAESAADAQRWEDWAEHCRSSWLLLGEELEHRHRRGWPYAPYVRARAALHSVTADGLWKAPPQFERAVVSLNRLQRHVLENARAFFAGGGAQSESDLRTLEAISWGLLHTHKALLRYGNPARDEFARAARRGCKRIGRGGNKMRNLIFTTMAALLALALAAGCGAVSSPVEQAPPVAQAPTPADGFTLPPVAALDSLRGVSSFERIGNVILTSPDAVRFKEVGYANYYYSLTGNDAAPSWVIARFGPDWGAYPVPGAVDYFSIHQEQAAVGGWYGVADFAAGVWRWQRAESLENAPDNSFRYCDDVLDPVSPEGCVYLAVVAFGAGDSACPPERPKIAIPETDGGSQ